MEVIEAPKVDDLLGHHPNHQPSHHPQLPSVVKLEHPGDLKELVNEKIDDVHVPTSASVWSFLIKRSRYLFQIENGSHMNQAKMTLKLLHEVQKLLSELSGFVRSCCDPYHPDHQHDIHLQQIEECIMLDDQIAQALMLEKGTKIHVIGNPPSNYLEEVFTPFKEKEDMVSDLYICFMQYIELHI